MAIRQDQRRVFYYEMISRVRARHAKPATMKELCDAWKAAFDAGAAQHERESGSVLFRMGDIKIDDGNQTAALLIRRGDANAADVTFSKKDSGKIRTVVKDEDELGDVAAHLVISLSQEKGRPDTYAAILEKSPGLGHHVVRAILNAFLKAAADLNPDTFRYPHPAGARDEAGNVKQLGFAPSIELRGLPSADLLRDIERGKIHGIDLITSMQQANLGGDAYLEEDERILKMRLASGAPKSGLIDRVVAAAKREKADYHQGRIRFTDEGGKSSSVSFSLDSGSIEQDRYVRNHLIENLSPPVPQSSETLVPPLASRMTSLLISHRVT